MAAHRALTLGALSASYVLRRPLSLYYGLPAALRLTLLPALAAWSAMRAAAGAAEAFRIGLRAHRAPLLRRDGGLLVELADLAPACTLVSDAHLVVPGQVPVELADQPAQWPDRELPTGYDIAHRLARLLAHVAHHAPGVVVWCGDEVDTGDPREWEQWQTIVDVMPGLVHRLVPGNHDICFNHPYDEDFALARRAMRERAYQQHAGSLAELPVADTIVTEVGAATLVLLDSCRNRSRHVLSNAIGCFGDVQLDELAQLLARTHGPVLCIAHHHVWREAKFEEPVDWYTTAIDAGRLIAILGTYQRRDPRNAVLVCHGHQHLLAAGFVDDIAVVGLPSSTLGDKSRSGVLDGVLRYAVAGLRSDGSWGVSFQEVT